MKKLAVLLSFLALTIFVKEEIIWHYWDYPPYYIVDKNSERYEEGIHDRTLRQIESKLENYEHKKYMVTIKRMVEDMKNRENICCASISKSPEREEYMYFSKPAFLAPPNGIIIKKEDREHFKKFIDKEGYFDLKKALQNNAIGLGISKDRVYRQGIDEIIAPYKEKLYQRPASDIFVGLLHMLDSNRALDAILGAALELPAATKRLGLDEERFEFFIIKDTDIPTFGYMACSKSEKGKVIIQDIDRAIVELREDVFPKNYIRWLDKGAVEKYLTAAKKSFQEK